MTRIYTFGFGQHDPRTGRSLANRFVRVDAESVDGAHTRMIDRFGRVYPNAAGNWAFDYETEDDAGVDRFHLIAIDFETGQDLT